MSPKFGRRKNGRFYPKGPPKKPVSFPSPPPDDDDRRGIIVNNDYTRKRFLDDFNKIKEWLELT